MITGQIDYKNVVLRKGRTAEPSGVIDSEVYDDFHVQLSSGGELTVLEEVIALHAARKDGNILARQLYSKFDYLGDIFIDSGIDKSSGRKLVDDLVEKCKDSNGLSFNHLMVATYYNRTCLVKALLELLQKCEKDGCVSVAFELKERKNYMGETCYDIVEDMGSADMIYIFDEFVKVKPNV